MRLHSSPACYNSRVPDAWHYKVLPKTPPQGNEWQEGMFEPGTICKDGKRKHNKYSTPHSHLNWLYRTWHLTLWKLRRAILMKMGSKVMSISSVLMCESLRYSVVGGYNISAKKIERICQSLAAFWTKGTLFIIWKLHTKWGHFVFLQKPPFWSPLQKKHIAHFHQIIWRHSKMCIFAFSAPLLNGWDHHFPPRLGGYREKNGQQPWATLLILMKAIQSNSIF